MKFAKRIYCIEMHRDYGKREVEPSVDPLLRTIEVMGQWPYVRRSCATLAEMNYFLETEWPRCRPGSILYIVSRGEPRRICLSDGNEIRLEELSKRLGNMGCRGRLVHLGGCAVMEGMGSQRAMSFLKKSGAMGMSGYTVDVGAADTIYPPALALELLLFSSILREGVNVANGSFSRGILHRIKGDLKWRFPDCGFRLFTQWDGRKSDWPDGASPNLSPTVRAPR